MVLTKIKINTSSGNVTLKDSSGIKQFDTVKTTVKDVKVFYCNNHNAKQEPDKITFRMKGKKITDDNQTLHQIGIKFKVCMFTMTTKVHGGAQEEEKGGNILNRNRNRKLDKSDPDIKLSNEACCVYLDKNGDRAKMPCGHTFSPPGMFNTLKGLIKKNDWEYIIKCPSTSGCGKEMDFDLCAKIADLDDEEYEYFLEELEKRAAPETQACPDCGMDCERPENLTMYRVNCDSCSGGDWCFMCAQKWRGGGFTVCGNANCELYDINDILAECPMKKATNGVDIPEIRACPNCLWYIEHEVACKHMKCPKCGHDFCFACLKPKKDGNWQCGSYTQQCVVAPRQKF